MTLSPVFSRRFSPNNSSKKSLGNASQFSGRLKWVERGVWNNIKRTRKRTRYDTHLSDRDSFLWNNFSPTNLFARNKLLRYYTPFFLKNDRRWPTEWPQVSRKKKTGSEVYQDAIRSDWRESCAIERGKIVCITSWKHRFVGFCLGKKCGLIASLCDLLIVKVKQMCATTKKESKYNDFLAITLAHDRRSACVIHLARVDRWSAMYVKWNVHRICQLTHKSWSFLDRVKKSKQCLSRSRLNWIERFIESNGWFQITMTVVVDQRTGLWFTW